MFPFFPAFALAPEDIKKEIKQSKVLILMIKSILPVSDSFLFSLMGAVIFHLSLVVKFLFFLMN